MTSVKVRGVTFSWEGELREDSMITIGDAEPEMFAVMIGVTNGAILQDLADAGVLP